MKKQREVFQYFIEHPEPILCEGFTSSDKCLQATIKTLIAKELLKRKIKKYIVIPMKIVCLNGPIHFPLTEEQAAAIKPIQERLKKMNMKFFFYMV